MRCSESLLATLAAKPEPPTRTEPTTTSSSASNQVIYVPGTSPASSPEHRIAVAQGPVRPPVRQGFANVGAMLWQWRRCRTVPVDSRSTGRFR